MIEVTITGSVHFEDSKFNGEDYVDNYDLDEDSTIKEAFIGALNMFQIDFEKFSSKTQEDIIENMFYDFVSDKNKEQFVNITVNIL